MGQNKKQKCINQRLNDILAPLNEEMKEQVQKSSIAFDMNQFATFSTVHGENFPIGEKQVLFFMAEQTMVGMKRLRTLKWKILILILSCEVSLSSN